MLNINACATVTNEALKDESTGRVVLTGAATIEYLAGLGAVFALAEPRSKRYINPRSYDGMDESNFLDTPMSEAAAITHSKQGGTVGLLPEHCSMALIDDDAGAGDFIREYPALAMGPRIFRDNAPDRIKLLVFCPDAGDSIPTMTSADGTRRIEIIGKRHAAVVAGVHESGAVIKCETAYSIPLVEWAQLVTIAQEWTGQNAPVDSSFSVSPSVTRSAQVATVRTSGDMLKSALIWWMQQPVNVATVDALVEKSAKGKFVAIRTERTPSARATGMHDGRRTWRDYGSKETLDDYEIYCRLNGVDKRTHKWQVVNDWRRAQGMRPLEIN